MHRVRFVTTILNEMEKIAERETGRPGDPRERDPDEGGDDSDE